MPKELNNPAPDSEEEQSEKGTELEEGKEKEEKKEEVALPEKFKTTEELVKAYNELESHLGKRDETDTKMRDRLSKLEGILETQEKAKVKPPEITKEERVAMTKQFKDDFNKDPLIALHNFNAPFIQDARLSRERADKLAKELDDVKEKQDDREMRELAAKARGTGDNAKLFDEMIPQIQDELKKNPAWRNFDNPYEAIFYNLNRKSTKNLVSVVDEDREALVEGSSPITEDAIWDATMRK